ncbi:MULTISPECIES: hypothetical protein [unclassified Neglectibacter]|uniref:hypothetical protein n=1 Tax=unclassified Neglectibacter TaxID=2632164 RepID=UPI00136D7670|nr:MULTISPECIES: hypothetical protein [unclassified Neglectibacter]
MVKTHSASRFVLLSLEGIRDTSEVILQAQDTGSNFEGGKRAYLCEVVRPLDYSRTDTADKLAAELMKVNEENRALRRRLDRLNKELKKARAGA